MNTTTFKQICLNPPEVASTAIEDANRSCLRGSSSRLPRWSCNDTIDITNDAGNSDSACRPQFSSITPLLQAFACENSLKLHQLQSQPVRQAFSMYILTYIVIFMLVAGLFRRYLTLSRMPPSPSSNLRFLKLIDPTRPADGRIWTFWTSWKHVYDPIFSIPFGVHNTIVVANAKVAKDLMPNKHKRHIYSSRADFPMTMYLQPHSLLVMPTRPKMSAQRSLLALGLRHILACFNISKAFNFCTTSSTVKRIISKCFTDAREVSCYP
jgi:hypothetical protein